MQWKHFYHLLSFSFWPCHWNLYATKRILWHFSRHEHVFFIRRRRMTIVIVVHEARKRFVGSLKNLVICQFERWHNTKSQFRRAFHLDRSHALSLRHSLIPFQRRNDHTCIEFYFYLKWKHFDMEINCVKSNCNALNLLMVIISKTFCFIYESDATTRTYIQHNREQNLLTKMQ